MRESSLQNNRADNSSEQTQKVQAGNDEPVSENNSELKNTEKALLNILDDYTEEKYYSLDTQKALLNILDDYSAEKAGMENAQRAILNILEDFTEENQQKNITQQNLIQSERQLSKAQEIAHLGSWEMDLVTGVINSSDEACRIFGVQTEERNSIYDIWQCHVHPEDKEFFMGKMDEAHNLKHDTTFHHRIVRKDGSIRHLYVERKFEFDSNGNAIRRFGIVQDVTNIREAEELVRQSETNLRAIFDSTDTGFLLLDENFNIKAFNKQMNHFAKISLGFPLRLQANYNELIMPERQEESKKRLNEILKGESINYETNNPQANGKFNWYKVQGNPVWNAEKKITGICIVVDNIIARKKSEEKLRVSELQYRRLFEAAKDGILILNAATGIIDDVNPFMIEMLGYTHDVFLRKHLWEIGLFKDIVANEDAFLKLKKEGYIRYENLPLKTKDGKPIWVEFVSNAYDVNGKRVIQCNIRDITARKKAELKLDEQNKELVFQNEHKEKRAAELVVANKELAFQNEEKEKRAAELVVANKELAFQNEEKENREAELVIANKELAFQNEEKEKRAEELAIANKDLRKTNEELDRFVYSTSHDLRAPLKSMLGLISITKESIESSNSVQHERMEMLNKSVLKLDNFIEDILHYSRNTRMEVVKEAINFAEMIQEIKSNHKFMQGTKRLKLHTEVHNGETFLSDKRRISVILNNLISNAIKYHDTSKEYPFVNIFVVCSKENAVITIKDNGIGIADKDKEKIFEMFYRATKISTGSGIGLYIVKETLEKLGASIHLESELNKGTEIIVTIPNQFTSLN